MPARGIGRKRSSSRKVVENKPWLGDCPCLAQTYDSNRRHSPEEVNIMIETLQTSSPKVVGFKFTGKLHDEDYKKFVPAVDAAVAAEGKVRLFFQLEDFHGWDLHAAWDDFRFGINHYSAFDRIAMVGDRNWEKWLAVLGKPFTKAKIRYFDASEVDAAWNWIGEG
jgi:hypothetical protein